jgi:hypothetical protein
MKLRKLPECFERSLWAVFLSPPGTAGSTDLRLSRIQLSPPVPQGRRAEPDFGLGLEILVVNLGLGDQLGDLLLSADEEEKVRVHLPRRQSEPSVCRDLDLVDGLSGSLDGELEAPLENLSGHRTVVVETSRTGLVADLVENDALLDALLREGLKLV